jgi:hypothetical protein
MPSTASSRRGIKVVTELFISLLRNNDVPGGDQRRA